VHVLSVHILVAITLNSKVVLFDDDRANDAPNDRAWLASAALIMGGRRGKWWRLSGLPRQGAHRC
jgi:hypothetical protein